MNQSIRRRRSHADALNSIVLAFPVALYPTALVFDITYLNTEVVQWTNFSA